MSETLLQNEKMTIKSLQEILEKAPGFTSPRLPDDYLQELHAKVVEIDEKKYHMENSVTDIYAELILPTIRRYLRNSCLGCEIMHPSQDKHSCQMSPFAESVGPNAIGGALEEIEAKEIFRIIHNRTMYPVPKKGEFLLPLEACVWRAEFEPITRAKVLLLDSCPESASVFTPWKVPYDIFRENL